VLLGAVALANSKLGSEGIGFFEFYLFLGSSLSVFWINGLIQGFLQVGAGMDAARLRGFIPGVYLVLLGLSALLGLLIAVKGEALALFLGIPVSLPLLPYYAGYLFLNGPAFLVEHLLLLRRSGQTLRRYGVYQFAGYLLAVGFPAFAGFGLVGIFSGLLLWSLGKHLFFGVLLVREGFSFSEGSHLKNWIWVSLPLAGYALLGGLHETFDNWLVNYFYAADPAIFAIYRYGSRELPLSLVLSAALTTAMIPWLVREQAGACLALRERSSKLMHLLFPLSLLLLWSSRWWFTAIFGEAFAESVPLFNTLLLIVISRTVFPQALMMALGQQKTMLWIAVAELLLNVLLSLLLVRLWGLTGIITATLLAYLFEKLAYMVILYRRFGIRPSVYHNWPLWLGYSLILVGVFYWVTFTV